MYRTNIIPNKRTEFDKEMNITPSAEANICLNCPLPTCGKKKCKRFEEEKRRLKRK